MNDNGLLKEKIYIDLSVNSGCIIIYLNNKGHIVELNAEAQAIYNWKIADVRNKDFFVLSQKQNFTLPINNLSEVLSGNIVKSITNLAIHDKGDVTILWTVSPIFDASSVVIGALLMGMNTGEYKLSNEREDKLGHFLNSIIDNVPHYIFWKDKKSRFLGCNRKFAEFAKKSSPKDLIGKSDFDMPWGKEYGDIYVADDKRIISTGEPLLASEEKQIREDGTEKTMLVSKVPLYDDNNKITGVLGIFTDITDRKEMEEWLRQSKEKAEAASRAKTEFIQNMSHDIRTPLTGVIGAAELLEKSAQIEDDRNTAHMVYVSGQRLLDLLNGVLDVVSADNFNDEDLHKETFDLPARMRVLHDLVLPILTIKGIDFVLEIDPNIPHYIISDRVKVERILLNLVSNAIKFTKKGKVELHIKLLAHAEGQVHLEFTVTDTGVGIPKEKIDQIFDRFFRVNPSYEGIYRGYGIGLYIVKKHVALLGGEVHVNSVVGKGTTFRFALLT